MEPKTLLDCQTYLEATATELNDLAAFDQMEMYRYLSQLGEALLAGPQPAHEPANFVKGCTSNVYIAAEAIGDRVVYLGSSEALIVRGYVAILVQALSGLRAAELVESTADLVKTFSESTNIRATLTPSRANAFGNIYSLMVQKAGEIIKKN